MAKNVVYGEVEVRPGQSVGKVGVGTETVETIMVIANTVWDRVRGSGIEKTDKKGCERLAGELQAKYKDFATTYPIVFQWMVHLREFSAGVFKKFIVRHTKAMYKTRKEFLEKQAEYVMMNYKKTNPRASTKQISRRRALVVKSLEEDDERFQNAVEEAKEVVAEIDSANSARRRKEILAWARRGSPK
jgi:hypothetical protein